MGAPVPTRDRGSFVCADCLVQREDDGSPE
jgi:hypothetical protein